MKSKYESILMQQFRKHQQQHQQQQQQQCNTSSESAASLSPPIEHPIHALEKLLVHISNTAAATTKKCTEQEQGEHEEVEGEHDDNGEEKKDQQQLRDHLEKVDIILRSFDMLFSQQQPQQHYSAKKYTTPKNKLNNSTSSSIVDTTLALLDSYHITTSSPSSSLSSFVAATATIPVRRIISMSSGRQMYIVRGAGGTGGSSGISSRNISRSSNKNGESNNYHEYLCLLNNNNNSNNGNSATTPIMKPTNHNSNNNFYFCTCRSYFENMKRNSSISVSGRSSCSSSISNPSGNCDNSHNNRKSALPFIQPPQPQPSTYQKPTCNIVFCKHILATLLAPHFHYEGDFSHHYQQHDNYEKNNDVTNKRQKTTKRTREEEEEEVNQNGEVRDKGNREKKMKNNGCNNHNDIDITNKKRDMITQNDNVKGNTLHFNDHDISDDDHSSYHNQATSPINTLTTSTSHSAISTPKPLLKTASAFTTTTSSGVYNHDSCSSDDEERGARQVCKSTATSRIDSTVNRRKSTTSYRDGAATNTPFKYHCFRQEYVTNDEFANTMTSMIMKSWS